MKADQLRRLAEIIKDEAEWAEELTTAETLRRISDRIMEMATDGDEEDGVDATGSFRVGDKVVTVTSMLGNDAISLGATGTVVAACGDSDWITVRFVGHDRDWRCNVAEVDKL
jgi:hypothetical protein